MKRTPVIIASALAMGIALSGCDWSGGGGEDFNSSRGGATFNISGYFKGLIGGRAVSNTTGGPIGALTIQQSGNRIDITDSNGSKYSGQVGSPQSIASPDANGALAAGAQISSFQVSWSGRDGTAGKDIEFTGVISLVAVQDIKGDTTTRTITDNNGSTSTDTRDRTITDNQTSNSGTDSTQTGNNGTETSDTTNETGDENSRVINSENANESSDNTTRVITTTYSITANNSQMRLQGSWIEAGGNVSKVDALSAGAAGGITTQQ